MTENPNPALLLATVRIMAAREWPEDECVKALTEDYDITAEQARELLLTAKRSRQEIDLSDTFDELVEN